MNIKELILLLCSALIILTVNIWVPAQQDDADHLKSLNCKLPECTAMAQMTRFDASASRGNSLTLFYKYSFLVNNKLYSRKITLYYPPKLDLDSSYLPDRGNAFKPFSEKILFDPKNPSINLPAGYVYASPRPGTAKDHYMPTLLAVIIGGWFFYFWFKIKRKKRLLQLQ